MLRPSSVFVVSSLLVAWAVSAEAQTTYYPSIGSALDYTTGTVTAVNGETYVIGSLDVQWKTENRGRGDRIEVGVVYKGSPFLMNTGSEELVLNQAVTDAVHTIALTVTSPNRHHGVLDTGVILDNGSQSSPTINALANE